MLLRMNGNYCLYWLIFKWRQDVFCKVGNECSISWLKGLMESYVPKKVLALQNGRNRHSRLFVYGVTFCSVLKEWQRFESH